MNSRPLSGWTRAAAWTVLATALPIAAQAHPGHPEPVSWVAGGLHPWSGWDHALALLGTGLWGAQWGGRARWVIPSAFLGGMVAGLPMAARIGALPGLESLVLASLLMLGLALAFAIRASTPAAAALVGFFALAHGASHGHAAGISLNPLAYAAGFMGSSALCLTLGVGMGLAARRVLGEWWLRCAGAALALGGLCGLVA